jgi:hypothetical protein
MPFDNGECEAGGITSQHKGGWKAGRPARAGLDTESDAAPGRAQAGSEASGSEKYEFINQFNSINQVLSSNSIPS